MAQKSSRGNVIIIYGGGLVDPAKVVLMGLAKTLFERELFDQVFIGAYSFESLFKRDLWFEYNQSLEVMVSDKRGTFFGTCRDIELDKEPRKTMAINTLKENNIRTVVVAGGDGSARNVAEMIEFFLLNEINIIFAMPLTIDGINGSKVIGRRQAVRESVRQIENIASTSLQTKSNEKFSVVLVELQGRNRDDIMAKVTKALEDQQRVADFSLNEILLLAIPATIATNVEELISLVNASSKRTLILVSEGSTIKIDELAKRFTRKTRSLVVGHPSQSNNQTTAEDAKEYQAWITFVVEQMSSSPYTSFSTSFMNGEYEVQTIAYYAKLNPRKAQKAILPEDEHSLLERYTVQ